MLIYPPSYELTMDFAYVVFIELLGFVRSYTAKVVELLLLLSMRFFPILPDASPKHQKILFPFFLKHENHVKQKN